MKIVTDSCSDLSPELLKRYNIGIVPLSVSINGVVYRDLVELDQHKLFSLVEQTGEMPKTAAATVAEYTKAFEGDEPVICITISSKLSGSFQTASIAAEMMPPGQVKVIDSLNLSTGIGHLGVRAAELRDAGWNQDAVVAEIQAYIPHMYTSFVLDTLDYVYKGGRCSAVQNILGSVLRIHPVISVQPDGALSTIDKQRGARQHGLNSLLKTFTAALPRLDKRRVFITHTTLPDEAEYLAAEVKRLANPEEVFITEAGSVIASHCGPNTIGILYHLTS
ncbi:MAG: DegV family protein [Anaerolineae bacterium]